MKKFIIITIAFLPTMVFGAQFTQNLRYGSKGEEVKKVQALLGVEPSGFYGAKTQQAVKAYQKEHDLPKSGYWGAMTRAVANATSATTTPVAISTPATTTTSAPAISTSTLVTLVNGVKVDVKGIPVSGPDYFKMHNTCIGAPNNEYVDCVNYSINLPPAVDPIDYYKQHGTCSSLQDDQYSQCMAYVLNPSMATSTVAEESASQKVKSPTDTSTSTIRTLANGAKIDAKGRPTDGPSFFKMYGTCMGSPDTLNSECVQYSYNLPPDLDPIQYYKQHNNCEGLKLSESLMAKCMDYALNN